MPANRSTTVSPAAAIAPIRRFSVPFPELNITFVTSRPYATPSSLVSVHPPRLSGSHRSSARDSRLGPWDTAACLASRVTPSAAAVSRYRRARVSRGHSASERNDSEGRSARSPSFSHLAGISFGPARDSASGATISAAARTSAAGLRFSGRGSSGGADPGSASVENTDATPCRIAETAGLASSSGPGTGPGFCD